MGQSGMKKNITLHHILEGNKNVDSLHQIFFNIPAIILRLHGTAAYETN
jgi:hypothetical protein